MGISVDVADSVFEDLEKFTCLMYGSKSADINSLRHEKFIERFSTKPGMVLTSYDGVDKSSSSLSREPTNIYISEEITIKLLYGRKQTTQHQVSPDLMGTAGPLKITDSLKSAVLPAI